MAAWPSSVVDQRSPALCTMSLLQKFEFFLPIGSFYEIQINRLLFTGHFDIDTIMTSISRKNQFHIKRSIIFVDKSCSLIKSQQRRSWPSLAF